MTITKVEISDDGNYLCEATNKIATVNVSAHLNVECKYKL